jgi:hypothetical protein
LNNIDTCNLFIFSLLLEMALFGLWCLMPLSTIFQLYRGSFIGNEK